MNKKILIIIYMVSFILLSYSCSANKKSAINIGKIKISPEEFESAFSKSIYGSSPTKDNRQKFLELFIDRKLILKEAQNCNYDKDPEFLEDVQTFWEQSLLKLTLNRKIKELSSKVNISEQEVIEYYESHKEGFLNKPISEVYGQIKLQLFKNKQKQALDDWINSLKKKSKIKIDYKLLGLE